MQCIGSETTTNRVSIHNKHLHQHSLRLCHQQSNATTTTDYRDHSSKITTDTNAIKTNVNTQLGTGAHGFSVRALSIEEIN